MASEENIRVAVRLRPFLQHKREEADGRQQRIIHMDDLSSTVSVTNPENPLDIHKFTFDNVLWSFDGYGEQADGYLAPENKTISEEMFCDQKQVYEEIGKDLVQNLWNGYNSTLFTFGESKSGKSWTLLGLGSNKGIVPQSLTDLFKGVREKEKTSQQNGASLEVRLSMAEFCNDKVKDLLPAPPTSTKFRSSAKIREHSKKGFYTEGLRNVLVLNHDEIQQRLEEGLTNRAVFLTNTNATSGNSLLLICVTLVQKIRNHRGDEVTRMATLEFIDLPAGEFAKFSSVAQFDIENETDVSVPFASLRKNGIENLSSCVDWLLEVSLGKAVDASPFSSHSVTKILRNALTGNSKSLMAVTISPSGQTFANSIFVLGFAEKVRMLTTRPVLNEEVTSKLIRELKGENEKLRKVISLGEFDTEELYIHIGQLALTSPSERESIKRKVAEDMKGQIRENEKEIRNLQQPFEERMKPFKNEKNDLGKRIENDRKNKCHLLSLNEDSQISGRIIHIIPFGTVDFGGHLNTNNSNGNGKGRDNHFIAICGPGILDHHGTFTYNKDGKISVKPAGPNCKILVNEVGIQFDTILTHSDRIFLGGSQVWIYQNPKEPWIEKYALSNKLQYNYVVEETAMKTELFRNLTKTDYNSDALQQQLLHLLPALDETNSIVQDLNQNYTFQPLVIHSINEVLYKRNSDIAPNYTELNDFKGKAFDKTSESSHFILRVQNSVDGTFTYWSLAKFFQRLEILKETYLQFVEDGELPLKEVDGFKENSDVTLPIGYSIICLKPLAYLINIEKSSLPILDFVDFHVIGTVNVSICIWDDTGERVNDNEIFVASPEELLDQHLTFGITIHDLQTITFHFKEIQCKYTFLSDTEEITKSLDSKSNFTGLTSKHEKKFMLGTITDNILNYLLAQFLVLRFYGKQRAHKLLNLSDGMENGIQPFGNLNSHVSSPIDLEITLAHLKIKEKAEQRQLHKLNALKALVDESENLGEQVIPVCVMKTMLEAKSRKLADQNLEEHLEALTAVPEDDSADKNLPPELKALKKFSEVCSII